MDGTEGCGNGEDHGPESLKNKCVPDSVDYKSPEGG